MEKQEKISSSGTIIKNEEKVASKVEKNVFDFLEESVKAALKMYSNVHRGSGYFSMITTRLYERAREVVMELLELDKSQYVVIFCTLCGADKITTTLNPADFKRINSNETGLALGVFALAIKKDKLPAEVPFLSGGGNARLFDQNWVVWAKPPGRFEAGTPPVINVIVFVKALILASKYGETAFLEKVGERISAHDILYRDDFEKHSGEQLLQKLSEQMAAEAVEVPTETGMKKYIHLDYAASTPALFPTWDAFRFTLRQKEDVHKEIIGEVKTICHKFFGAPEEDYDVIFTSNTTEAINLTAESFSEKTAHEKESFMLSTLLEHSSNDLPWRELPNTQVKRLSFDSDGFFDLQELETFLEAHNGYEKSSLAPIRLVAVTGASNVLGTYNDLEEISRVVHKYGAELLVDAAQMAAHRSIDMQKTGIDYLAFSAHKMYAPFGSGGLLARKGLLFFGSDQLEKVKQSGEQNPAGIAALGKAMVLLQRIGMKLIQREETKRTAKMLNELAKIPGVRIFGIKDSDSPAFAFKGGVIPFEIKEMFPQKQARLLSDKGAIGVRYGCHCAHIAIKKMVGVGPFIKNVQRLLVQTFPKLNLPGVVRASIGIGTTDEEVETFLAIIEKIATEKSGRKKNREFQIRNEEFAQEAVQRILG